MITHTVCFCCCVLCILSVFRSPQNVKYIWKFDFEFGSCSLIEWKQCIMWFVCLLLFCFVFVLFSANSISPHVVTTFHLYKDSQRTLQMLIVFLCVYDSSQVASLGIMGHCPFDTGYAPLIVGFIIPSGHWLCPFDDHWLCPFDRHGLCPFDHHGLCPFGDHGSRPFDDHWLCPFWSSLVIPLWSSWVMSLWLSWG